MLDMGVIEESHSARFGGDAIVFTVKKDGFIWFCVDHCKVNEVLQFDAYPIPGSTSSWLVTFFNYTDFNEGHSTLCGLYQFVTLPFSLFRAPATFQLLMDQVLHPHVAYAAAYLDDVIIHSMCSEWL